jgi:hypothetical protein
MISLPLEARNVLFNDLSFLTTILTTFRSNQYLSSAAGTLIAAQIVAIVVNHISLEARNVLFCAQHVVDNKCCYCC